jgi:hypothetical protein
MSKALRNPFCQDTVGSRSGTQSAAHTVPELGKGMLIGTASDALTKLPAACRGTSPHNDQHGRADPADAIFADNNRICVGVLRAVDRQATPTVLRVLSLFPVRTPLPAHDNVDELVLGTLTASRRSSLTSRVEVCSFSVELLPLAVGAHRPSRAAFAAFPPSTEVAAASVGSRSSSPLPVVRIKPCEQANCFRCNSPSPDFSQ